MSADTPADTPAPDVLEALTRVARGEGGVNALAEALARTDGMVLVVPESAAAAYLRGLERAVGPNLENYGDVKATDVPAPIPAGLPGPGGRPATRAFTSQGTADTWARAHGLANGAGLVVTLVKAWPAGMRESLARDDVGIVIDDGTDRAITMGRSDLVRVIDAMMAPAPPPPPAPPPTTALLARARARPTPAPVAGPGRSDDDSRTFWAAINKKLGDKAIATWLAVETLAYEMDVHIQIDPQVYDGLRWPSFYHIDEEQGRPSLVYLFAGADALRDSLVKRGAGDRVSVSLAGVEALRWIVAAPAEINFVAVIPRLQDTGRRLPVELLLPALLPAAHPIDDLRQVPAVGLERLGRLPGARALRPECVRALVLGWRNLVAFKDQRTVEIGGRAFKPVASSMDAFFASVPRDAGRVEPDPAGKEPPFGRWLAQLNGAAGLVLDPASGAPLTIEPIDLLVLDCWTQHAGRQPVATEVLWKVAELLAAGRIAPAMAGRIAADLPVYWIAVRETGGTVELLMFPNTDALCLFTSGDRAESYVTKIAQSGLATGFASRRVRFGWSTNPLVVALESFTEAWIDPEDPFLGGGLRLSNDALRAAVARLDETLKPRVPDFIAG
jgi:hypothetical protein